MEGYGSLLVCPIYVGTAGTSIGAKCRPSPRGEVSNGVFTGPSDRSRHRGEIRLRGPVTTCRGNLLLNARILGSVAGEQKQGASMRQRGRKIHSLCLVLTLLVFNNSGFGGTKSDLGGTYWQLIRFVGGDNQVLRPDQRVRYTIGFGSDGAVNVRCGCSRGGGSWQSSGSNIVEFGPLTFTRVKCPLTALDDRLPSDLQYVRSYLLRDGHLFLSLLAEQGTYEFEPMMR